MLGVKKGDSNKQIKQQYREMVKKYHPDKNHDPQVSIKFNEIVNAYEHLVS
ncbi:TPA: J domain-containing protein [Enterococcus faecium]|uniref:J domain-containing protein n=1 Tax=Enterococcus faecium TaxID=1352 RepID=UPI000A32EA9A|nr:DnaJ domain-containing protein [Enterococcus faecium]